MAQVAFSILLVVGAGLLARALHRSGSVALGFDQHGVEVAAMDLSLAGYTSTTGPAFIRELGDRLRKLPAVQDATMATGLPTDPDRRQVLVKSGPGAPPPPDPQALADMPSSNAVAPGYFSTLRIPLLAGRDFTYADREGSQPVAIVSAAAARLYWPGQNAVGQYLRKPPFTSVDLLVVGVARDLTTGGSGRSAAPDCVPAAPATLRVAFLDSRAQHPGKAPGGRDPRPARLDGSQPADRALADP